MATDKEAQAAKIDAMLETVVKLNAAEKMNAHNTQAAKLSVNLANGGTIGWTQEPSKWFNASLTVNPIYEAKDVVASPTAKPKTGTKSVASITKAYDEAKNRHDNGFPSAMTSGPVGEKDYFAFTVNGSTVVVHRDDLMELLKIVDQRARAAFPPDDML